MDLALYTSRLYFQLLADYVARQYLASYTMISLPDLIDYFCTLKAEQSKEIERVSTFYCEYFLFF